MSRSKPRSTADWIAVFTLSAVALVWLIAAIPLSPRRGGSSGRRQTSRAAPTTASSLQGGKRPDSRALHGCQRAGHAREEVLMAARQGK
jgi:hypothetical protein